MHPASPFFRLRDGSHRLTGTAPTAQTRGLAIPSAPQPNEKGKKKKKKNPRPKNTAFPAAGRVAMAACREPCAVYGRLAFSCRGAG
ncbi:predicted protein [Plenodomus lingam JN3]|uniref:Predicted protein n=1 Tax=Leptosphaeria maculans (strain JN3 / isolate v23.1.3 / race Av1-4-5-6-7-8) TaxID=985895 RepID=E4ZV36_LEPMJ|nr:predicted protein [Plenodomus lingam JN3]CBX95462.1 predicted protein [Plenodomus lingam JN3]